MWKRAPHPMQLNPVGTYSIKSDQGTPLTSILTLGPTMSTKPAFPWQPGKEQWFTPKGADVTAILDAAQSLSFRLDHHAQSIDPTIQAKGDQLANTSSYTFQLYALSVLSQNDWIPGMPGYGPSSFYFEEENPEDPSTMMRLLFTTDQGDPTKILGITWVVLDNSVSVYFSGVPDGTTYTLARKSLGDIPSNGYYYTAP